MHQKSTNKNVPSFLSSSTVSSLTLISELCFSCCGILGFSEWDWKRKGKLWEFDWLTSDPHRYYIMCLHCTSESQESCSSSPCSRPSSDRKSVSTCVDLLQCWNWKVMVDREKIHKAAALTFFLMNNHFYNNIVTTVDLVKS